MLSESQTINLECPDQKFKEELSCIANVCLKELLWNI